MHNIERNGTLSLSRGDHFQVPLFINIGTDEAPIRLDLRTIPDAQVYFGVYLPDSTFYDSVIAHKYTYKDCNDYGDIIVNIFPAETASLYPGNYFYEAKLVLPDSVNGDFVGTVINKTRFQLY